MAFDLIGLTISPGMISKPGCRATRASEPVVAGLAAAAAAGIFGDPVARRGGGRGPGRVLAPRRGHLAGKCAILQKYPDRRFQTSCVTTGV
jgi:hypothetical protein